MLLIRNLIYWLIVAISLPIFGTLALVMLPFRRRFRHYVVSRWTFVLLWGLKHVIGLRFKVVGAENIPTTPSIIACKHQSGWETLALQAIFPQQVWVAKKELLWIPFLGWGLASISTIFIDRKNGAGASQQLTEQGRARIKDGFWIVIFPEGTRIKPGKRGKYRPGGARLSKALEVPLVPVALNSGEFWPKDSFLKSPGEITVVVGAPLLPRDGQGPEAMMREAEEWIENEQLKIGGAGPFASSEDRARRMARQPA